MAKSRSGLKLAELQAAAGDINSILADEIDVEITDAEELEERLRVNIVACVKKSDLKNFTKSTCEVIEALRDLEAPNGEESNDPAPEPAEEAVDVPAKKVAGKKGKTEEVPVEEDAPVAKKPAAKKAAAGGAPGRFTLFDLPATAVLRALGKAGCTFVQVRPILNKKKCLVADATVKIQLAAGKKGERGEPAKLTRAQIAEFKD